MTCQPVTLLPPIIPTQVAAYPTTVSDLHTV
jgi:hypothetical protein